MPSYFGSNKSFQLFGTGNIAQRFFVDHEADRACVDGNPVAVGILEIIRTDCQPLPLKGSMIAAFLALMAKEMPRYMASAQDFWLRR